MTYETIDLGFVIKEIAALPSPDVILCGPEQHKIIQEVIAHEQKWGRDLFTPKGLEILFGRSPR